MKLTTNKMVKIAVVAFFISCNILCAISGYSKGAAPIDYLRAQYLQLEAELWSIVENGVDQSSVLNQILGQHKAFIDQNVTLNDYNENEFYLLEKIYEWNVVKESMMPIRSLFDSFTLTIDKNAYHFNNLELTDLADTILSESEQINGTAENIENLMVKQGTYYKVMLVNNVLFMIKDICYVVIRKKFTKKKKMKFEHTMNKAVLIIFRKPKTWFAFQNNQHNKYYFKCIIQYLLLNSKVTQ